MKILSIILISSLFITLVLSSSNKKPKISLQQVYKSICKGIKTKCQKGFQCELTDKYQKQVKNLYHRARNLKLFKKKQVRKFKNLHKSTKEEKINLTTCTDINECNKRAPQCIYGQKCQNTIGNYQCIDINECRDETHNCKLWQNCVNDDGDYYCQNDPTIPDTSNCSDYDEEICAQHYNKDKCGFIWRCLMPRSFGKAATTFRNNCVKSCFVARKKFHVESNFGVNSLQICNDTFVVDFQKEYGCRTGSNCEEMVPLYGLSEIMLSRCPW